MYAEKIPRSKQSAHPGGKKTKTTYSILSGSPHVSRSTPLQTDMNKKTGRSTIGTAINLTSQRMSIHNPLLPSVTIHTSHVSYR